jgi:hypothetical protein
MARKFLDFTEDFSGKRQRLCYHTAMKVQTLAEAEPLYHADPRSEKNLAVAILRQAWHEAVLDLRLVKETSRKDYRLLKKRAVEWIASDQDGFPYWCRLACVDHCAVRQKLQVVLRMQRKARRITPNRPVALAP